MQQPTRLHTQPGGHEVRNRKPLALRDIAIVYTLVDSGLRASELCKFTDQGLFCCA